MKHCSVFLRFSNVVELKHLLLYTGFQSSRVKDENPGSPKEINVLLSRLNLLKSKIDNEVSSTIYYIRKEKNT